MIKEQMPRGFRETQPVCCQTCRYSKIGIDFYRGEFVDWKCLHPDSDGQVLHLEKQKPTHFTCDEWEPK